MREVLANHRLKALPDYRSYIPVSPVLSEGLSGILTASSADSSWFFRSSGRRHYYLADPKGNAMIELDFSMLPMPREGLNTYLGQYVCVRGKKVRLSRISVMLRVEFIQKIEPIVAPLPVVNSIQAAPCKSRSKMSSLKH